MIPQETQVLQDFLNQLTQARGIAKDPQADALIASAVAQQPDAAYLLVQRALLMDQALNAAKAQVATLQSQLQAAQPVSHGFLDSANAWGNSPVPAPRPASAPMMASAPAPYQSPMQAPAPTAGPSFFGGGVGNVLGTVAATAAGVAGGAFLFQGIEHMMGHNSGAGFLGQQPAMAAPAGNTTINNYYGDDTSSNDTSDNTDVDVIDDSTDDGS
jgi:hypothetical protein